MKKPRNYEPMGNRSTPNPQTIKINIPKTESVKINPPEQKVEVKADKVEKVGLWKRIKKYLSFKGD